MPWLYAIARRVRVDRYRKTKGARASTSLSVSQLPERAATPEPQQQTDPKISDMLQSLPESQREVLLMLKVSGLSLEEVARATGSQHRISETEGASRVRKFTQTLGRVRMNDDLNSLASRKASRRMPSTLKRFSARWPPAAAVSPLPSNTVFLTISLAIFAPVSLC